jgi:hypothetical protein
LHLRNIVASDNDYFRGDATCGAAYSLNTGRDWNDAPTPMSFVRGVPTWAPNAREYWQGGGDTSVAWDTKGNAYLSCQSFNRGTPTSPNPDLSSAFYLLRSTATTAPPGTSRRGPSSRTTTWPAPARCSRTSS